MILKENDTTKYEGNEERKALKKKDDVECSKYMACGQCMLKTHDMRPK